MPMAQIEAPALTDRQRRFVDLYVENGGRQQGNCARLAGIASTAADAWASRALRHPGILAELRRIAETRMQADVIRSTEVLRQLRDDASVPPAERRKAASELLDRAGMIVAKVSEHNVNVTHEDRDTIIRDLIEMAGQFGLDPKALIGGAAAFLTPGRPKARRLAIEAEYDVVDDGAEVDPDDVTDGADPEGGAISERTLPPTEIIGRSAVQEAATASPAPTPAPVALVPRRRPGRPRTAGSVAPKSKGKPGRPRKVPPVADVLDDLSDILGHLAG